MTFNLDYKGRQKLTPMKIVERLWKRSDQLQGALWHLKTKHRSQRGQTNVCLNLINNNMQVQCLIHEVSSQFTLFLYQTLKNKEFQLEVTNDNYVCRQGRDHTEVVLVDEAFQSIVKIIKLPFRLNSLSFQLIQKDEDITSICLHKNAVQVSHFLGDRLCPDRAFLHEEHNQQFQVLSNQLSIQNCKLLVAYTKNNDFYLIALKQGGSFEVTRLINKEDILMPKGWLQLFKRQAKSYSYIRLYLFRIDKYERFSHLLVIRDNNISLHLIQLRLETQQSTISLIKTVNDLTSKIPRNAVILQNFIQHEKNESEIRRINLFLALQAENSPVYIVKVNIEFTRRDIYQVSVLFKEKEKQGFSFTFFDEYLYYTNFNPQTKEYQVFRNKLCWLQADPKLRLIDQNPFLMHGQKVYFQTYDNKLYLIAEDLILVIKTQQQESDFSFEQRRWLDYKETLNNIYLKKWQQLQNQNTRNLIIFLSEKQLKINNWLKIEGNLLSKEEIFVKEIFGVQIVCIIVLKATAAFIEGSNSFLKDSRNKLFQLFESSDTSRVISFLLRLIQKAEVQLLRYIIAAVKHLPTEKHYCQGIKTVFQQPFSELALRSKRGHIEELTYLNFISQLGGFSILDASHFVHLSKNHISVIKETILKYKLSDVFIHYFMNEDFPLTVKEFRRFIKDLKSLGINHYKEFVCDFLNKCKQKQQDNRNFLFEKLDILTDGLLPFEDDVYCEIDAFVPGLNIFILLKRKDRRKLMELLSTNSYFQQLQNKNVLYLLFFDILNNKTQINSYVKLLYDVFFIGLQKGHSKSFQQQVLGKQAKEFEVVTHYEPLPCKKVKQ